MDEELRQHIIRIYGTQCEKHMDEIIRRLTVSVASLLFAGELGDNVLCKLNRAFNDTIYPLNLPSH